MITKFGCICLINTTIIICSIHFYKKLCYIIFRERCMFSKIRSIDMRSESLPKKILIFAIPLLLSGVLQLLYNAADVIVVGQFVGKTALAAVGSNSSIVNLLVQLFMGFAVGINVLVAQGIGSGDREQVYRTVHTSALFGVICGVGVLIVGFFTSKQLLVLMSSPDDVIELSAIYLRIYFLGAPGMILFNFGSAILRAAGDTRRPMIFLIISGMLNVVLNLVFVLVFNMSVAGVALATSISNYLSAVLVIICLMRSDGMFKLDLKKVRIYKSSLIRIISIGLPAGVQGVLFSFSNVLIQSSVNSFGSVVMAGNAAAISLEGFVNISMDSVTQAAVTASGQNTGAKQYNKLNRILWICCVYTSAIGIIMGVTLFFFGPQLISLYAPGEPDVIETGMVRMRVFAFTYFIMGIMNIFVGLLRGMGYSLFPMLVSVVGICFFRVVWIYSVFAAYRSLFMLYISYPISWTTTLLVLLICYFVLKKRLEAGKAHMRRRRAHKGVHSHGNID